ncbi:tubby-related protein 4-like [Physella acuta]|uniref:tubby-related protein 4-like n=1 Tax=Physella acuta TaxID=109671 RepID=UPI0027DDB2EC|nr:tubby-related protein 4-like [Physella acuta]XP_059166314.1 tubby-related protein 4-like [Physella acuta]
MHVHFEQNTCTRTDSNFLSLSWMGKVPEDLPEEGGGWKLNRAQYYVEGWLASGNARGVVGVTFSTSHCHKYDAPPRSNFNLRGHRSEVILVRWNEPYQKLATCDSRGVIFVWIKHEGRWSIELINDRNSQVTDFAWSHDGRMALICYRDGFILVGSVAGQRYWSSMLNLDNTSITCAVWSPDDQQVMFGTLDGQIIVMSSTGTLVTQVSVHEGFEITSMAWSCERFNMEEAETGREGPEKVSDVSPKCHVLAVCFKYGDIFLMSNYDDVCPIMVYTTLTGVKMDWSNCGDYLAVGGFVRLPNLQCRNQVHFYSKDGSLIHWVTIPSQGKPLTAMTWGHNDKRLFLAAGCHMYVAWVSKQVAPLQFLCQRVVHQVVRAERAVEKLPLPQRLRCGVKALFSPTIKSYIPDPLRLREFVCSPPPGGERLFCTMIRHGEETSGGHYTLYLEYLGGLVPLLKGKRASKLRPDFIIYDPKIKSSGREQSQAGGIESESSSESDADVYTDGCGSPRMQRRRRHKVFRAEKVNRSITFRTLDELMYDDNLPENTRLVEVTSNIWGTKFQITGVTSSLPACLGQVVYKTSLLHLQPRQMTITITEMTPARQALSRDPNFTPAPVSDDEDSFWTSEGDLIGDKKTVEVTVHDAPSADVRGENGGMENGNRSLESPQIEASGPYTNDLSSLSGGKMGNSGTVRSRSLSPVRNSLTQSSPAIKQEGSDVRPDSCNQQGARPKSNKRSNSHRNSSNSGNIPASSPKLPVANGKRQTACTSLLSHTNGVPPHPCPTPNKVDPTLPVGVGHSSKYRRVDLVDVDKGGVATMSPGGGACVRVEEQQTGSSQMEGSVTPSRDDACPRWADPAAHAVKVLEDTAADGSELPFENNLVADCSPTAPFCLDLHRRLYLAQHNIVDTGAPISPSSCPACLPAQCLAEPEVSLTFGTDHHKIVTQHAWKNRAPDNRTSDNRTSDNRTPDNRTSDNRTSDNRTPDNRTSDNRTSDNRTPDPADGPVNSKVVPSVEDSQPVADVLRQASDSDLTKVLYCSNCLSNSESSHTPGFSQRAGTRPNMTPALASQPDPAPHQPLLPCHRCTHPTQHQGWACPHDPADLDLHLPKDLTSLDKLNLILSEEPGVNSAHNFRSMPGFFMRNPDIVTLECQSPSVEPASPDNCEDSYPINNCEDSYPINNCEDSYPINNDYLSNHIQDLDIQQTSASLPSSPIRFGVKPDPAAQSLHEEILKGRCKHLSPLLGRKGRDSPVSAQDVYLGMEELKFSQHYQNLEAFQKAQLKQKLRRRVNSTSGRLEQARTFTMHNKAPLWNETSQVYQLDFGGRVTQESAKNFQIELRGKQVMQFGRIDNNAYTLDFQYPFTAVQAFAVALANVTQRLK